ncbi:hypothetical protein FB451DRAFT_1280741 [Mycena latifolia]|nr:hypothetical protein FB451DRAFT_1280741 [Mycena latifolia]
MPALPQELLDAIVGEVDDVSALKSCSLAGSLMRDTSQRILLSSLKLTTAYLPPRWPADPQRPNYREAVRLLEDSPHIAEYITRLTIELSQLHEHIQSLQQVLSKLGNVRRCIVGGGSDDFQWEDLPPSFASALLEFLQRQPLRELYVNNIEGLPASVVGQLVGAVAVLSFYFVELYRQDEIPSQAAPKVFAVEHLILGGGSEDICAMMLRPEFVVGVASLRSLSIPPDDFYNAGALIRAASGTLQYLRLDAEAIWDDLTFSLPRLPELQSLKFGLDFGDHANPSFLDTVTGVLTPNASPLLAEITISLYRLWEEGVEHPLSLGAEFMTKLDTALAAHPGAPHLRWRFDFHVDDGAQEFDAFAEKVRRGMRTAEGAGRLALEAYVSPNRYTGGQIYES